MATISVEGSDLYYERRGSGEPLLLIQGLGGNSLHWGDRFLEGLQDRFELVLYDHAGAGRSGPPSRDCTTAALAQDAVGLLNALHVESAHVMGISMGGMVAQQLVLAAPQRVRTLTLGCSFPGGAEARMTDMAVVGMLAEAVLSGDVERTLRVGYDVMVAPSYAEDPANYALYAEVAGLYPTSTATLMAQLGAVTGHDTSARLGEVAVPTLVMHGTADRMLHPVNGELLARLIPGARLELLEGAGHLFFWEEPERTAALVREFVEAAGAARRNA